MDQFPDMEPPPHLDFLMSLMYLQVILVFEWRAVWSDTTANATAVRISP